MRIVSIGEILWDVFAGSEHLGGAPFNFAAHASRLGNEVIFLSAVGTDHHGSLALARVAELGLPSRFVRRVPDQPTGFVSVELCADNQPRYVIHRPAAYDFLRVDAADYDEISKWRPDWVYYGTLHQMHPLGRRSTDQLLAKCPAAKRFYDVNLRVDSYTADLVLALLETADVVKLNESEVGVIAQIVGNAPISLERFCRQYVPKFGWEAVCVTRGAEGCVLLVGGQYVEAAGYAVKVRDPVGAGDAFAAGFLHGLASGWPINEIADFANRLGALVASREGAVPWLEPKELRSLARRTEP